MLKRLCVVLFAITLVAAACSDDNDTDATPTTQTPATTASEPTEPETGPASIAAIDQSGDGSTVTVSSVTLPTGGFVVIHADNEGSPGPILGWSDLLPAGESSDVVVTLNTAISAETTVFPMAHVDANGNSEYEFMPPDVTIDVPATTAEGSVAVLSIVYTVS